MTPGTSDFEKRNAYLKRYEALKQEREPWVKLWRDLADNFAPMLSRFDGNERQKKTVQRNRLLNSSPIRDGRILAAGMMTSVTSPARKWFKLSKPFNFMANVPEVREWLEDIENGLFQVFARSNLYSALSACYRECGIFGIHAFFVEEDESDVVRAYTLPIGSYCLASSDRRVVDTLYRDVWLTTAQIVSRFGLDACSEHIKSLWNAGDRDTQHKIIHVIEPSKEWLESPKDYRLKPYDSIWFEENSSATGFLRKSGYNEFPVMAPRWAVVDNDTYGSDSPGMISLGDAKLLQVIEASSAKIMENGAEPALLASAALRNQKISMRPGEVTFGDSTNGAPIAAPLQVSPPHWISILHEKIKGIEEKISSAFFVDLFLALSESDRREMTAEEVRARQQEKMLQLGPVLERLNDELLDPLIDRVFAIAYRKGYLPPAPEELDGQTVRVEYLSILTQAQKTVGVSSIQAWLSSILNLSQIRPDVLDKVAWDQVVDDLAEMYGVPPRELADSDDVQRIRDARAQQMAMQQQLAAETEQANQVKTLAQAQTEKPSALTELLNASGPYAASQV